jgi:modulator of FtsH protease HflK
LLLNRAEEGPMHLHLPEDGHSQDPPGPPGPPGPGLPLDRLWALFLRAPVKISLGILGGSLLVMGLATSYYQVEPDEVGVVQRFGRYAGTTEPGPHFRVPYFIDEVTKLPVQRQLKLEFGFRSNAVPEAERATQAEVGRESLMLTGDLNVAMVEWIVQYKIKDPYGYLFKVRSVTETLRYVSEAAMRIVVGDHSVNEVLTTGRQQVAASAKLILQGLADRYEMGIDVQQVVLQSVHPPDPVKPSFNEVNQAIQEKEREINKAQGELNRELPRARGEAAQSIQSAEGYAVERVNRARGEADRFQRLLTEYKKAPAVTRRRLHLETMAEVLPRAGHKVILDEKARGLMPLLRMGGMDGAAAPGAAAAQGGAR